MNATSEEMIARDWARLGVLFNVTPAEQTPDVEGLLLNTVRSTSGNSRLLIMAATWMVHYADYVAKRRLAIRIRDELEIQYQPIMGLLLEWVQTHGHRNHHRFREALKYCARACESGPLLMVNRRSALLRKISEQRASVLSRRWGVWMEEFEIRDKVLRSPEWIAQENPALQISALCGGDLVATIAADAAAGLTSFQSESQMARRYGASRAATRDAVLKLKMAGYAQQTRSGKAHPISVTPFPRFTVLPRSDSQANSVSSIVASG